LFAESFPGFFPEREHHRVRDAHRSMAVEAETGSNARQVFGEELKSGLAVLLFRDAQQD